VLDYGAEIAVIATGSRWSTDGLQGITNEPIPGADAALSYVATPDQIMVEGKAVGRRVLVYDCETYFTGVGVAEKLIREGHEVTYVTPLEAIAPYTHYTLEFPRLNRLLRQLGVEIVLEHVLTQIEPGRATIAEVWTEEERELEPDTVVLVTQRISNDALYRELIADEDALGAAGIKGVYQIGDCVCPSLTAEAVFSGHRLAREIDSPNPAMPLPYIRERRLLNATEDDYQLASPAIAVAAR
jgi:dimethylamine/trimethylamine dehydrogenase